MFAVFISSLLIASALSDCPHEDFLKNNICDSCRGWREVFIKNILKGFAWKEIFKGFETAERTWSEGHHHSSGASCPHFSSFIQTNWTLFQVRNTP